MVHAGRTPGTTVKEENQIDIRGNIGKLHKLARRVLQGKIQGFVAYLDEMDILIIADVTAPQ